jgi:hypothetical protein
MTPRPAWFLVAFLFSAHPASATDILWGIPDFPDRWPVVQFQDMNGKTQKLSYHAQSFIEMREKGDVPLYTMTKSTPRQGVNTVFQSRLSGFRATGKFPFMTITAPGTKFVYAHTHSCAKSTSGGCSSAPLLKTGSLGAADAVITLMPVAAREDAPLTFFPENKTAFSTKWFFPTLEAPPQFEEVPKRVHRRFVAFEMLGVTNPNLAGPFGSVVAADMNAGPAYEAAKIGDVSALDAWVKGRREGVIAKSEVQRSIFETEAGYRPENFNFNEGELLWTLVHLSGARAAFTTEIQSSLASADKRKAFATKYRNLLRAELTRYIDGAKPLVEGKGASGPVSPATYNAHWQDIVKRVTATVAGDAAQLASNADPTAKTPVKGPPKVANNKTGNSKPKPQEKKDDANLDELFGN